MTLDKRALLAWLRSHAEHPELVVYAVLTGLAGRIERGDFDEKEPPRNGGGTTPVELESGDKSKAAPAGASTPRPGPKTTPLELEGGAS